jgi:Flp pilus assembly protein TadB
MLSKAAPKQTDLTATQRLSRRVEDIATTKIWLPKLLYDSLPWFYLFAGLAALLATLYVSEWFWVLPHYLLFSAACLHLAYAVYRKRRRSRPSSRDDSEA